MSAERGEDAAPAERTGRRVGRPHSMVVVLVVGVVVSAAAAFVVGRGSEPVEADESQVTSGLTTRFVERVVTIPGTDIVRTPVSPPKDEYANEPVTEIGTIEIPTIGLTHRIFHGITMRNIDLGPSHWPGTAFPGEAGNAVFAGHRVTKTRPFRDIHQLVPGDLVHFTVRGVRSTYSVTGHKVVTPKALEIVEQTPTPTATLFACHPPGSARYRYVVTLGLVS